MDSGDEIKRSDLPPPVAADLDLTDFPWMKLHVERLLASDLAASVGAEAFRAAVLLWCRAWHQIPAGSLPNDDRILAAYAGFGRDVQTWLGVKKEALHGFDLYADGRLYHSVVCEVAIQAFVEKRKYLRKVAAMNEARSHKTQGLKSTPDYRDEKENREQRTEKENKNQPQPPRQEAARGSSLVVEKVAPETQHLLGKLYAAANNNVDHSDKRIRKIGPITDLENEGCDLDLDILPTIKAQVPKMRTPLQSWGAPFLADHIRAARDRRRSQSAPKPKLTAEEERLQRQRRSSNHRYAHLGRDELIALWRDDQAEYHELEMLEVDLTDPADLAELARRNEAARQFALKLAAKREAQKQAARKDYIAGLIAGNLAWNETIMGKKPSEAEIDAVREEMARES